MAILSFLSLLLITLLSQATAQPGFLFNFCINDKGNYTANSTYQRNLNTLLSNISSPTQSDDYGFFNLSYGQSSDRVNAIALCRGDVSPGACQTCLNESRVLLTRLCPNQKEAIAWYDNCMLRYSNRSLFYTVETLPAFFMTNVNNATSVDQFNQVLRKFLDDMRSKAASGDSHRKFAAENATGPDFQTIYGLVQCTPDLSSQQCTDCLDGPISQLLQYSGGKIGGRYVTPSCNYRYETYRFYNTTYDSTPPPPDAPSTQAPTEPTGPTLLSYRCIGNTSATDCLTYLFDSLSSNAINETIFNFTTCKRESETNQAISSSGIEPVYGYGMFLCSGYVSLQLCHQCVREATAQLSFDYCKNSNEAIIWYNECTVRYSNRSFFSIADTSPSFIQTNDTYFNFSDSDRHSYLKLFWDTMNATAAEAAKPALGENKYASKQANISRSQSVYCAAQCTPDLSPKDCRSCLSDATGELNYPERQGGRILYPSCNVRYELYPFYQNTAEVATPVPLPSALFPPTNSSGPQGTNTSGKSRKIIMAAISIIGSGIILFCIACYFLQKKMRKGYKVLLKEIFGIESTALESLQFNLATIEAATNKFSQENKIGRGGFGEVYKGILLDGREIAIKRLSRSSGQGAREFKNEVSLMAKLQHRNLVTLLGFCLEGQEKILIYEYVPNNSLDFFLFGTQKTKALNWSARYKIIEGIAQGILYLHRYSRLKIIHRDLKPSNVLLDNNMNPKISDFGMARMIGIDETQGSTNRIVGTYGYMSPEYAMLGQFSEESDVFSFGVMVLEIISGRKNARNGPKSQCVDGLLSYAWKQWRDKKVWQILDSSLTEVGSHSYEVIKCIHIGLLCVQDNPNARPPIITVVQYLNNDSIELPLPKEPAFFIHGRIEPINIEANEAGSINMMSASELFPR